MAGARVWRPAAVRAQERALGPAVAGRRDRCCCALDLLICAGPARPAAAQPGRRRRAGCWLLLAAPARARAGQQRQPGARRPGWATSSPATPRWTASRASRAGGTVRIRQPTHRRDPGRTRSRSSRARPISASIRCCTGRSPPTPAADRRTGRGAERLHEPRRHHPDRHARLRLRRRLRAGHRAGAAAGRAGPGRSRRWRR